MSMTVGTGEAVPSYDLFRRHAVFVPELGDFCLREVALRKLLAEVQLLWGGAAMGLGDLPILVSNVVGSSALAVAASGRPVTPLPYGPGKVLTYHAVVQICSKLHARASSVHALIAGTQEEAAAKIAQVQSDSQSGLIESRLSQRPPVHDPTSQLEQLIHKASMIGKAVERGSSPYSMRTHSSAGNAGAGVEEAQLNGHRDLPLKDWLPEEGWWMSTTPGVLPADCSATVLGSSLLQTPRPGPLPSQQAPGKPPPLLQPLACQARLIRELVRVPACEFAAVRPKIASVQTLLMDSEYSLAASAVVQVVKDWEAALQEKGVKASMKRSKKGGDTEQQVMPGPCEVVGDGAIWLRLVAGMAALGQGRLDTAEMLIDAAEEVVANQGLSVTHTYTHAVLLCKGLLQYQSGNYPHAAQTFSAAQTAAASAGRVTADPLSFRDAGAAANNLGVTVMKLGDKVDAVRAFRSAVALLRHEWSGDTPKTPGGTSMMQELLTTRPSPTAAPLKPLPRPTIFEHQPSYPVFPSADQPAGMSVSPHPEAPSPSARLASARPSSARPVSPSLVARPASAAPARKSLSPATGAAAGGRGKGAKGPISERALGLDGPAALIAMSNLQGAVRAAFNSGVHLNLLAGLNTPLPAAPIRHFSPISSRSPSPSPLLRPATAPAPAALGRSLLPSNGVGALSATAIVGSSARPFGASLGSAARGQQPSDSLWEKQAPLRAFLSDAILIRPVSAPAAPPPCAVRATPASVEASGKGKGKGATTKTDTKGKDKKGVNVKKDKGFKITYTGETPAFDPPQYGVANVKTEGGPKKKRKVSAKKKLL